MPRFAKLEPLPASLIKSLFPPSVETADLQIALQEWGAGDIDLTPAQIEQTRRAIRERAIPKAQAFVYRSPRGPLREDAQEWLDAWRSLDAMLASAR